MQMQTQTKTPSLPTEDQLSSVQLLNMEIRRAANSFLGITEELLDSGLTREQQEYVEVLRTATDRLLSVGGRIVLISSGAAERASSHVSFDLRELVDQTAALMRILGADNGIQVVTEIAGNAPWPVTGDRQRVEDVLLSIVSVVTKSVSPGCVKVIVHGVEAGFIQFDINGPAPLPSEGRHSLDSQAELIIDVATQTVKLMGGTLSLCTTDASVAASFTIPLAAAVENRSPDVSFLGSEEVGPNISLRVLLAEDSPDNQFTIRAFLKNQPYLVDVVDSGDAAVEQAKSGDYGAILMDIELQGLSGRAATKAIREWERSAGRPAVPIIALTAHSGRDDVDKCLEEGFTAYLSKPVRKQTILTTLQRYLRR